MVPEKALPIAPVRGDVLVTFEHGEESRIEARNVAQECSRARSHGAIRLNEAVRFEHERLPRDRVDAAACVLACQILDIDHAMPQREQRLAFASYLCVGGLELGETGIVVVVVADKGRSARVETGLFRTVKEPRQAIGNVLHPFLVRQEGAYSVQHGYSSRRREVSGADVVRSKW